MKAELLNDCVLSSYNEDTDEQLDYYINERKCEVGDKAYLYSHAEKEWTEMIIVHVISRTDDTEFYDRLTGIEDVLLDGEEEYFADTSAEFISDNNCYMVWFKCE